MLEKHKIVFLLDMYLIESALAEANLLYVTEETKEKIKLLIKYKPEPRTPEYGVWVEGVTKFLKSTFA
jgi:hypothetical protein